MALLREYDMALTVRPELADDLGPLRAAHQGHLDALGGPAGAPSPSPSPTGDPESRTTILSRLARAESNAAARRVGQCRDLRSGELARLVAAVGGAEAAHASRLRELGGTS